jgi:membrane protein DedA with SNARE-associated domain
VDLNSNAVNVETAPVPRPSLPPPPLGRPLLLAIGALVIATTLGSAFVAGLALHYPLLLIALSPLQRHIILIAPRTPVEWVVPIAALRGLCACVVAFEVGRLYGPQGIRLFEKRSPALGPWVRRLERVFAWAGPVLVFVMPGPLTSTLAAISGLSRTLTLALSLLGLAIWAWINHRLGDLLAPYTAPIMEFVKQHLLETTVACVLLVVSYQWIARKRRLAKAGS